MPWKLSTGSFKSLTKYFPMSVIFLQYFPLIHLIPDWLSPPNRAFLPPSLPPLSFSSSILSDCNYLIIPAFVTHWPRLAFSCSSCPSPPLQPFYRPDLHVDAPRCFEGHSSSQDSQGPSGAIMGLMTGEALSGLLVFPALQWNRSHNSPS